jgi:uncharacterized protein YegP (UPF0339 family)
MKKSRIELYADKSGKFRFRLVAKNGETVAQSESYESMASAKSTAKKLATMAAAAEMVDTTKVAPTPKPKKK